MPMNSPAVVGKNVVFRYGSHTVVTPSSFSIPEGSITAIIGPNGSGKSTTLNGIAGLTEPSRGTIDILPIDGRPRRVSYVLQTTKVNDSLPITVREVVTMGRYPSTGAYGWMRDEDRAAVRTAMERMDITNLAARHLTELSGGQRQRVFVAQGLAQDHEMLLLDEPLTGLDITSAQAIDDVIHEEQAHGCTIVLTTHDLTAAQVADYVVLMSGRVVAAGTPDEVLTEQHLRDAYGPSLIHAEGTRLFLDDPVHRPAVTRHEHRDRSIHLEVSPADQHGGDDARH
ncbi:MAG TPA: metal ABC transporter ATP-binding protein [Acidimicrobiia bacterium]|nr:metal ABC transporter ATP-binding protein [Acidimicrobiia bacterium]